PGGESAQGASGGLWRGRPQGRDSSGQRLGGPDAAHGQARRVREVTRATSAMEERAAWDEPPSGRGASVELRDGPSGDDPISEVSGTGSSDRQRSYGVDVQ